MVFKIVTFAAAVIFLLCGCRSAADLECAEFRNQYHRPREEKYIVAKRTKIEEFETQI